MKELIYLSHRIPYPPDKGDKIRSWNLLRFLTTHWRVHLGTFIDDPKDNRYRKDLDAICAETKYITLNRAASTIRSLKGFIRSSSLTMPYYERREMRNWVSDLLQGRDIDAVVAFSSSMAQYAAPFADSDTRIVIDFCDLDSDKWRQYSEFSKGPLRWIYRRESEKLQSEEKALASVADASVFVSKQEAAAFCRQTRADSNSVFAVSNGVDTRYFDPTIEFRSPFAHGARTIVFVGAMDYWPNVDAVCWFSTEVLPDLLSRDPNTQFWIVGANPDKKVLGLDSLAGVSVTGRVDDVRPYLAHAGCIVAPLRIARGIQNKVLEAMAMARPVIATPQAMEGINAIGFQSLQVCETSTEWAEAVSSVLDTDAYDSEAITLRRHVSAEYSWEACGYSLANVVSGAPV